VRKFCEIAAAKLPALSRMIAGSFGLASKAAEDIVNESLATVVATFIEKIQAGDAPMDGRRGSVLPAAASSRSASPSEFGSALCGMHHPVPEILFYFCSCCQSAPVV
jgi:hypothetical protein